MSSAEMSRWFNQTLDNVRLRHRKLLRFGRSVDKGFVLMNDNLISGF